MIKQYKNIFLITSLIIFIIFFTLHKRHHNMEPFILALVNSSNTDSFIKQNYPYFDTISIEDVMFKYLKYKAFKDNRSKIQVLGYKSSWYNLQFYKKWMEGEIITVYCKEKRGRLTGISFHVKKKEKKYIIYKLELYYF